MFEGGDLVHSHIKALTAVLECKYSNGGQGVKCALLESGYAPAVGGGSLRVNQYWVYFFRVLCVVLSPLLDLLESVVSC